VATFLDSAKDLQKKVKRAALNENIIKDLEDKTKKQYEKIKDRFSEDETFMIWNGIIRVADLFHGSPQKNETVNEQISRLHSRVMALIDLA
jgi:hypothetical protein